MSSSVTMKALQSGWAVFSQTPGFFSTAAESCPVMGMVLVCRALAMADSRVSSVQPGPTPGGEQEARSPPRTSLCLSALRFVPETLSQVGDRLHDRKVAPPAVFTVKKRGCNPGPQNTRPIGPVPTAPPAVLCFSEGLSGVWSTGGGSPHPPWGRGYLAGPWGGPWSSRAPQRCQRRSGHSASSPRRAAASQTDKHEAHGRRPGAARTVGATCAT